MKTDSSTLAALRALYGEAFTDDEFGLLDHAARRAGLNPFTWPREISLARGDDGLAYVVEALMVSVADAERHFRLAGCAMWWGAPALITDRDRLRVYGLKNPRDLAVEIALFDNEAQMSYALALERAGASRLPADAHAALIQAMGQPPGVRRTLGVGKVLASEAFEARFKRTRFEIGWHRAMRDAVRQRIPTLGAHRRGAPAVDVPDADVAEAQP